MAKRSPPTKDVYTRITDKTITDYENVSNVEMTLAQRSCIRIR
jgi:hypothetical protein